MQIMKKLVVTQYVASKADDQLVSIPAYCLHKIIGSRRLADTKDFMHAYTWDKYVSSSQASASKGATAFSDFLSFWLV